MSISWKKYHERCARERLQGKRGATASDIVKDILRGRGAEGATQEMLVRAVSMSTGIIADEVMAHWDDIEKALNSDPDYQRQRDGRWRRKSRGSSRRMNLR